MKQTIFMLTLTLFLLSCSSKSSKTVDPKSVDTLQISAADKMQPEIYIKDKSQYDKSFIEGLSDYKESIRLIDNYLVTGKDTTFFPEDFPLNKAIIFKGTKAEKTYLLTVTRTNLTNLTYNFRLTDKDGQLLDTQSGESVLGSMFFLASEMDKDFQTGEGYASYEYWDKEADCWFAIRIGSGKDAKDKQRAKVTYGCEDKNKPALVLEECPILQTE